MKRIISVLMENAPGALSRIVGVFSQRGYNVDSLCVAATDDKSLSRLTITTQADDKLIELKTICHCGRKATMVIRVDADGHAMREGAQVEVGGNFGQTVAGRPTHQR